MLTTFQTADGRTLSYHRRGSGPLVVCIPGGPGMDPVAYFEPMEFPGFELLVFAPRGTGSSSPPPRPDGYRIAGYVRDVEDLREHLGLETLTMYGNSHGGMVALAYALAHPDRIARFVITNAPARMDEAYRKEVAVARARFEIVAPDGAQRLEAADRAGEILDSPGGAEDRTAFRTLMAKYAVHDDAAVSAYLDRLCSAPMNWTPVDTMYEEMVGGLNLLDGIERVAAPALVIAGEYDVVVPAEHMRLIARSLPHASYLEFSGAGHFVEVEAGEDFRSAVTEFLRS